MTRREFLQLMARAGVGVGMLSLLPATTIAGRRRKNITTVREAHFYDRLPENKIQCHLCPFECVLSPDEW